MTAQITQREAEVLAAYSTGMTKKQVGAALFLSESTVKTYIHRVCKRLGVNRTWLAVQQALAAGWLDGIAFPPPPPPTPPPGPWSPARQWNGRRKGAPLDVAVRYPSTTWGEDEWGKALQDDDDLYFRILRGIGRASSRTPSTKGTP